MKPVEFFDPLPPTACQQNRYYGLRPGNWFDYLVCAGGSPFLLVENWKWND
jgi:hypothetical protein